MALALRLRRALAAASTAAPLLRPSASVARSLPLAPPSASPAAPLPRAPWRLLPGGAAGFRSTAAAAARGGAAYGTDDSKISPDEILFEGCDYNHWLITMEFPDPKPSREEMIETYLQTLAKVVGSYEEAKKRMYAFSTTTYNGFQAVMTEEMSETFRGLPGVVFILPDSYLYPETKEYGGDKYENGVITPRPPPVHYSKPSRTDRNRNYRDGPPQQGNYSNRPPQGGYQNSPPQQGSYSNRPPQGGYQNSPPQQGNYSNRPPPQGGYQNSPPQQGNFQTSRSQQDGRGSAPQQNYAQSGQDARDFGRNDYADSSGYNGPPGGFQGQAPQYQGHVNPAGQGQGYDNPQQHRNFSQGQGGGFRTGGPSAPGSYGQPSTPGSYGQPSTPGSYGQPSYGQPSTPGSYGQPPPPGNYGQAPPSAYRGGNRVPGVNPSPGGDSREGAGPARGGDNWQS